MENRESKFINIKVKGKTVLIPDWYSVLAIKEYYSSYEKYADYRKAFCNLIFIMINSKSFNKDLDSIVLDDIELISDNILIKIMKIYLNKDDKLNKYFQIEFNNDYFKAFYLANNQQFNETIKQLSSSINNTIHIPEIYKQIIPIYKSYKSSMQNIVNLIQSSKIVLPTTFLPPKPVIQLYQVSSGLMNFEKNIGKVIEPLIASVKRMQNLYSPVLPNISKEIIQISKRLKKFNEEVQQFKKIIIILGFPPHSDLLPKEITRIVMAYNSYGEKEARKVTYDIYIEHFNDKIIKEMYDKWCDMNILADRKDIIKQAINAHLHSEYYLSIPIVFSQIEGLIANVFHHKGQMSGRKYLEYVNKLLYNRKNYSFDGLISQFYSKIVLVTFHHNEPIESVLSRHAIMHGGDTKYGTRINSIKALLLFDYMLNKMNNYLNGKNDLLDKSS